MTFHPDSLKLVGHLKTKNATVTEKTILYQGPVRELCKSAPNNVNTMAAAAIAAHNLGFDETLCCLISDPSLMGWHIVDIEVEGRPSHPDGSALHVHSVRRNPAHNGQVTGSATFAAFFSSIRHCDSSCASLAAIIDQLHASIDVTGAGGRGPGIHLC